MSRKHRVRKRMTHNEDGAAKAFLRAGRTSPREDTDKEEQTLLRMLDRDLNNVDIMNKLIKFYVSHDRNSDASNMYGRALRRGVANTETFNAMIRAYRFDMHGAGSVFEAAVRRGMANSDTYLQFIISCINCGNTVSAWKWIGTLGKNPRKTWPLYVKIMDAFLSKGFVDDAIELFDTAIMEGYSRSEQYEKGIELFAGHGYLNDAIDLLYEALDEKCAKSGHTNAVLRELRMAGRMREAETVLVDCVRAGAYNSESFEEVIEGYGDIGDVEAAERAFRFAIERMGRRPSVYNAMVKAYSRNGLEKNAERIYTESKEIARNG